MSTAHTGFSTEVLFDEVHDALKLAKLLRASKERRHRPRWPVLLCGLVALAFGGVAFTESPLGQSSAVKPHVDAVRGQVGSVAERATKMF